MTMRVPVAFRWLAIAVIGWIGLRGPIVARDFANFRNALNRQQAPPGDMPEPAKLQPAAYADDTVTSAVHEVARGGRTLLAQAFPANPAANAMELDLPPPAPAQPASPQSDSQAAPQPTHGAQLAEQAYQHLRLGDLKRAATLLAAAAEMAEGDPRAPIWAADRRVLMKRWSGDAYVLVRDGGAARLLGPTPSLGGSQAGARLAYVFNPLSDQRITLSGRIFQPLARHSGRSSAAQAVLGIELQPSRKLPVVIAIDRYAALGHQARNAWALRLSGGAERVHIRPGLEASFYGQAGIIGVHSRDLYADGWAKLHAPLLERDRVRVLVGAGVWAGAQPGASRIDAGPSAEVMGRIGAARVAASVDYRFRTAGNARPGNGPAVSVRAGF